MHFIVTLLCTDPFPNPQSIGLSHPRAQVLECASDIMPEMDTKALLKASADKLRAAAKDAGKDSEKEAEEVIQKVETHEEAASNAKPSPPKQA